VQALPDPGPKPLIDGSLWPACVTRLLPGDNPGLSLELAAPAQTAFVFHAYQRDRFPPPCATPI
jgi:hypothetical protein